MANHLFIGLGGTGGKVLRELRKRVFEEFRSNEPEHGVYLDYIYVDSSDDDLHDRTGWKVMGKSVHLGEAQKVSIHGISASMFQNINMYPGLQAFLKPNDLRVIQEKMGPLVSAGIGGQRRRLGRTLMANNLSDKSNARNFDAVLHGAVKRLTAISGDNNITFHICAGLAGGTGSGSIIDVIAQIRKMFPYQMDTKFFKMNLIVYVPEMNVVTPKHDAGFYQANGYAALQEINAISVGKYHPLDVTGEKDIFTGEVQRLLDGEAFEVAYVYTNVNENGKVLDLGNGLPAAVADFLFQTNVANAISGNSGEMKRLVGCENDGAGPEANQAGDKVRSRKFISFGIKRIEFPENEIREFVSYTYATQAARQLTYNYWQEGIGYGERSSEEVGVGFRDEIRNKRNREILLLSNNHLMLNTPLPISDANYANMTKRWKDIETTWQTRAENDAADIQGEYEKQYWLGKLEELLQDYYVNNYRGHGVKKFYDNQRQEKKAYAKFIRRHVEKILFDAWIAGDETSKSILEIEKYTRLLVADCAERIAEFKKHKADVEEEINGIIAELKEIKDEWNNIGWLRDAITNASSKIFEKYQTARCNYYIQSTRIEAYNYAVELLQEIINEFNSILEGVLAFKSEITDILDEVMKEAGAKCKVDEMQDDVTIKKYNPEKVHAFAKQYSADKERQRANAASIRRHMVELLGEEGEHTFANLYDKVDHDEAVDIILDECKKNADDAMQDTAKDDPLSRMVGVNILEKLNQELTSASGDKLETFVKDAIASARTYVQFNTEEKSKVIGAEDGAMMSMIQVSLPKGDENTTAFRNKLIKEFEKQVPGFDPKEDVSENYKSNQIVIVAANAGFPLRYLSNVKTLKEKYDKLIAAPEKELNQMVLHTESFEKPLPSLFEVDSRELFKEMERPLMLAYTLGLIAEQTVPTTGERFEALRVPDVTFGGDTWVPLGKDFASTLSVLAGDFKTSSILKQRVAEELKKQAVSNEQKTALKKLLGDVINVRILNGLCGGNQFDDKFKHYRELGVDIINNELKVL